MREGSPGGNPGRLHNYFPSKEDLFLDRSKGLVDRLSRFVRARAAGESAAAAVLRELREEVESVSPKVGLIEGFDRFMKVVHGSAALQARLWYVQREQYDNLEATLRQETGAADDDPMPGLMAGQIGWVHETLMAAIAHEMIAGRKPSVVSREALVLLDEMEELLSEKVLNYAVRAAD
ncbi:TetR/AcrR family transcriptional regulator [Streptomyces inhibens]|uniref:TetR/AcrR family transcriptional regulator n=1 Tax=Streptomyces inhibens TaxID=2293571 RepID=UPI001EE7187E|nr:TetR/AcrR family transcriptional regulator [Streptomyces inhibens]UKY52711.1 TetR/AcrR family transcriptional regulator [Streptomyces inhibens]